MKVLSLLLLSLWLFFAPLKAHALYNPLERSNNFHGIHILSPDELGKAAELVNSSDGEWGYVTIPIQVGDKDLVKWQKFMNECSKQKLIPILRLSTEGDFFNTAVWRIPTEEDILDFVNFLDSINWPVENRYIIIFNEVNRFDEWGGQTPDPKKYTDLLDYAIDSFKRINPDFFVIMSGMDNAAPNDHIKYIDNLVFIKEMISYKKSVFEKLDGFASHSYPNPGFSRPPSETAIEGVATYRFEYNLIENETAKKLPVFITETGWNSSKLGDETVAGYYKTAYEGVWGKDQDKIVAITPFLLHSNGGPYDKFSFIKNGQETMYFTKSKDIKKAKGQPLLKEVKGIVEKQLAPLKEVVFRKKDLRQDKLMRTFVLEYVKFFF